MKKNFAVAHSFLLLPLVCSISLMGMDQLLTTIENNKRTLSNNANTLHSRLPKAQNLTTQTLIEHAAFINNFFEEQRDLSIKTKALEGSKIEEYYTSLFEEQEKEQKKISEELHQLIVARINTLDEFENTTTKEQRKEKEELLVVLNALNIRDPQEIDNNETAKNNFIAQLAIGYFFYLWSEYTESLTEHSFF
jgi:hypothetical protein